MTRLGIRLLTAVLVLSGQAWAPPAWAQDQPAAEALFRSAREAAELGDWLTACDRFEESYRLEPAPGTVLNLAKCREELGQLASAWNRYGEVIDRLPAQDPRVQYAQKKQAELKPQVPTLTLLAPEEGGDVTVFLNGVELSAASFKVPLPLDPGEVRIRVESPERQAWTHTFRLAKNEQLTQKLLLGELLVPAEPQLAVMWKEPPEARALSSQEIWGWTAVGVGGLGVLASAGGFFWALAESNVVKDHCMGDLCDKLGYDASQRGQTAVVLGWVGASVGVLGLGIGTYLLMTDQGENVSLSVRPTYGGMSLSLGGSL